MARDARDLVGAGLVGVEVAAELAAAGARNLVLHDMASTILPGIGSSEAQRYCADWLRAHGVELAVGADALDPIPATAVWCAGVKPRASFVPAQARDARGFVTVDRHLRVQAGRDQLFGGNIFAVGDCVSVADLELPKALYPGEEMASIAATNIAHLVGGGWQARFLPREMGSIPSIVCCSLGPDDGVTVVEGSVVSTGLAAAAQKLAIEKVKLAEIRGEVAASSLWSMVH